MLNETILCGQCEAPHPPGAPLRAVPRGDVRGRAGVELRAHALGVVRVHVVERRCVGDTFELIDLVALLVILAGIGAWWFYKKRRTAKAES